ncbi:hypothetical protein [Sphingomonas sp.]|uniref:hypothetical protein n=1 Tax=Sphingomonas sp. TaxID=28214 RepID=UPI00307DE128
MPDTVTIARVPTTDTDLIARLNRLTVALTDTEYQAATILAFDPDACMAAGQLDAGHSEPRDRQLAGNAMSLRAWRVLARACGPESDRLDDTARLALFLADRSTSTEAVPEPTIGARVRIRARQRIGGDRYAGREGVVVRTHFAGFYVKLDMTPRERSQKTELVETVHLEVLVPAADA